MPTNKRLESSESIVGRKAMIINMEQFKGVFPALLTPFTAEGKINEKELVKLVEMNLKKGVSGFYVGGSTAEAFLLSIEERKYILDIVAGAVGGKATVISHIGCIATKDALELARHSEKAGADAISSIPPFYYNFSAPEIRDYYFDIVDKVPLPMVVYHFPAFSGVSMGMEELGAFFSDPRFIGLKFTSNDFFTLERVKNTYPDKLVYNGFDEMFLAGVSMGADGGIGSTYNFMAEKFLKIFQLVKEGKTQEALEIQNDVNTIIKLLSKIGVMPGEKEVLIQMGFDFGVCRKPFKTVTEEEKELIHKVILPLLKKR